MALFGVGVISAFFAALMPFSTFVTPGDSSSMLALGRVGKAFYIFFLLGTIAVVANLEHTVRQSAGDQRAKIKYLILGLG
nr:hypothetical protein [candidate division Zixibacteria bacterium]